MLVPIMKVERINKEPFTGSWSEIKDKIVRNYFRYEHILFIDPDNGKEALIIPKKYSLVHLKVMDPHELRRISVY